MFDKLSTFISSQGGSQSPSQRYSTPVQGYQQQGYTSRSASQDYFSNQQQQPHNSPASYGQYSPSYDTYRGTVDPPSYTQYQNPPPPLPRYPPDHYQDSRDQMHQYGQYDTYGQPRCQERGLMGTIGGGVAGMAGGELLGGHPVIGGLAGAYLGHKMEQRYNRHIRRDLRREGKFFEKQRRYGQGYGNGMY